jgi:hypothetical protein
MPSKTKADQLGLPPGAMFTPAQVAELLNVTPRQLKRWRCANPPVLKAVHPSGDRGPAFYRRADLIEFLSR